MKIKLSQIPPDGSKIIEENLSSGSLDLDTSIVKYKGPLKARAMVSRITNVVSVDLEVIATEILTCGRCLKEFEKEITKEVNFSYPVESSDQYIDLSQDIREEIILDYPYVPLCDPECKGLCPKCGKNINEGGCSCATTKKKTF